MPKPKCLRDSSKCTVVKKKPDGTPYAFCEYHRKQNTKAAQRYQRNHGNVEREYRPRKKPVLSQRFRGQGRDGSRQFVAAQLRKLPDVAFVGMRGWPDLFYHEKNGTVHFVEVKGNGDSLSHDQHQCHAALEARGIVVEVITPRMVEMLLKGIPIKKSVVPDAGKKKALSVTFPATKEKVTAASA
jgi:hypothetical protein